MSVIFGIREEDKIIVTGDKRSSSIEGNFISDDMQKVVTVNEHLCIAFGGNASIQNAILKNVESTDNKETLLVEDLLDIINLFYQKIIENQCDVIYGYPFYCLIAGKGKDGKGHLYNAGKFKNGFAYKETPMALYPPADADIGECNAIFVKNYKLHHKDFYKRTVREIAQISSVVSSTGNCWIYGLGTHKGQISEF